MLAEIALPIGVAAAAVAAVAVLVYRGNILLPGWWPRALRRPPGRWGRPPSSPEAVGIETALRAATSTLPHLRRGLHSRSAAEAVPHLRQLTGAAAVALADTRTVLAIDGEGREQVRPGDLLSRLLALTPDHDLHIVPRLISSDPSCPLRSAVLAPLTVQGKRAGTLIAFYRDQGRPRGNVLRIVARVASLVSAQVELSVVREQEARLAQAELRALRAQISPHFIYNALAAVAAHIHRDPEEARELLTDFAEFTRYLFRDGRSYVPLDEELAHVERYLRLEQARFPGSLRISIDVAPDTRAAIVPSLSVQPLVENAVRHGVERRAGTGRVEIAARVRGGDVELRVSDDGSGIAPERVPEVLAGAGGGIGLSNVDARLRATFGERYGLRIDSQPGAGTTVIMSVPNLDAERSSPAAPLIEVVR